MAIRNQYTHTVDLGNVGLNLTASRRGLEGTQATIAQNMDHADSSGAIVGRLGTKRIAGAQVIGGIPLDLFRAWNGVSASWLIATYDDGTDIKVAAWRDGDASFAELQQSGGDFTMTRDSARLPRTSFAVTYDPELGKTVLTGTNGVDDPWYWDFDISNDVVDYAFGASNFKLKSFMPTPWKGRRGAWGRDTEVVTFHLSDSEDHKLWVGQGNSVFFQVPQDAYDDPLRCVLPFRNQMTAFNLNSIQNIYYSGDTASPFKVTERVGYPGTINNRTVARWNSNLIFISKTEPYLFLWNGATTLRLDPKRILTKGIQEWLSWATADLLNLRMAVHGDEMRIAFTGSGNAPGADGNRWIIKINLSRLGEGGNPYYPAAVDKIQANDIISADASTDAGQMYYSDNDQNYVSRYYEFWDATPYGDNNSQTGSDPDPIPYILQLGWDNFGYEGFKRLNEFWLDCDYEGTPATTDTLKVEYKFASDGTWQQLLIGATRSEKRIPFPVQEWFKEVMFKFTWTTKTAKPLLYGMKMWYQPKKYRHQ